MPKNVKCIKHLCNLMWGFSRKNTFYTQNVHTHEVIGAQGQYEEASVEAEMKPADVVGCTS